ncbi:MAG: hypothetical protein PHS52_06425 [Desulfotomaculaceae bacterium]|nr:hypothetical protein [Desulfotomaculaceae bacterium]
MIDHKVVCRLLNIPENIPVPGYKPYAVKKTKITVFVEGEAKFSYGGNIVCGKCGHEFDTKPEGDYCPNCGWNGEDDYLGSKVWIEEIQETFK